MKNDKSSTTFGPLEDQRSAEELNDDITCRLKLLMASCQAEATPDGWRRLAMYLVSRLPEFKFKRQPGDESKMHLPLMHIEGFIRTNYPVVEIALAEARQLRLSPADTNSLIDRRRAEAPALSIARAVRIEAGLDGTDQDNWTDEQMKTYETLLREYRKVKDKDALLTSAIRRGAHKSLRAWIALEGAFSQLEIQYKAKEVRSRRDSGSLVAISSRLSLTEPTRVGGP